MKDKQIERALEYCACMHKNGCVKCPYLYLKNEQYACTIELSKDTHTYIIRLKSEKQLAETQLKELLSAMYQRTDDEKGFTLYRRDIVELANDYGIKEEELK